MTKFIVLTSFHRGVGKSTISANLAVHAFLQNKTIGILEFEDIQSSQQILFGIDQSAEKFRINPQQSYFTTHKIGDTVNPGKHNNLYLLQLNRQTFDKSSEQQDWEAFDQALQTLSKDLKLDLLIIDSQAGLSDKNLSMLAYADTAIILLRTDQQDFHGTAILVDISHDLKIPQVHLLINQASNQLDLADLKRKFERLYNTEVVAITPFHENILEAHYPPMFNQQFPEHPFSKMIAMLAENLT